MTIGALILFLLFIFAAGSAAYWVITKFLPEPMRAVALAVVGVLLLLACLYFFWPEGASMRLWH